MLGGEGWEEIKCGILMNGIIALIKGIPENSLTLFLYHVRNSEKTSELSPHYTLNLLAPSSWSSQPTGLWEIHFVA